LYKNAKKLQQPALCTKLKLAFTRNELNCIKKSRNYNSQQLPYKIKLTLLYSMVATKQHYQQHFY